ncbi:alcohol dehydrogenase catalytic domain-containing protein [bacterium]|nr:alcohol dehydrogenase catalytic domain-containing protein [Verrucomicrobiota bacterium]MDA7510282.1 alcohol dehydrogenase catalytic domain-containing protein [Verrucomicrobiota bacterium]MDA7633166.1 alcohol dehydrogenase catalytic domain-containing protein [bacterium]
MRALVYNGPWDMTLEDLPKPSPAPGEVLVKMQSVGICGSDVHGFTGESGRRAPGMVMGHEAVGVVEGLGEGVVSPKVGDLVTVYNIIAETAPTPEEGDPSFLAKKVIGVNLGKRGAMADYLTLPAESALVVPEGVDPSVGILVEPVAVVTHGFQRLAGKNIQAQRAAIVGSGTIGLSGILVAKESGVKEVAILDTIQEKLDRGKEFGAHPILVESGDTVESVAARAASALGDKPDLVVDAVGSRSSFNQCIALVKPGGAVLLIGNLAKEVAFPLQDMVSQEISFIGTYGFDRRAFEDALKMVPNIQDKLASYIEGHCSLEEAPATMTKLAKGELQALKIVIDL